MIVNLNDKSRVSSQHFCFILSVAVLWVLPMRDFSVSLWTPTEGNGHGCQSTDGKWTGRSRRRRCHWRSCWTSDRERTLQPLRRAVRQESPSSSQVSNCLRPAPINALKTQYTTSLCRGTCSRRLLKKSLTCFHFPLYEWISILQEQMWIFSYNREIFVWV